MFLCLAAPPARAQGYTFTTINDPAASDSGDEGTFATGINDAGQIVGYISGGGEQGFVDIGGTFTTIDDPAANGVTYAYGINNAGQIVGTYSDGTGHHGFIATPYATPEPSQSAAFAIGVLGLSAFTLRARRRAA